MRYCIIGKAQDLKHFGKFLGLTGPWQSGLMHRTYNPAKRVNARSEGPNPSGPANILALADEEENRRGKA